MTMTVPADAETSELAHELTKRALALLSTAAQIAGQSPRIAEAIAQERPVTVEVDVVPHPRFRVIVDSQKTYDSLGRRAAAIQCVSLFVKNLQV